VFRVLSTLIVLTLPLSAARAADIRPDAPRACGFSVSITGDIAPGDELVFRDRILSYFERGCLPHMVHLNSAGGDLQAAIDIGRQVATLALFTEAPRGPCNFKGQIVQPFDPRTGTGDRNCICASACFFIWAAGAQRLGNLVVVHRPFFDQKFYSGRPLSEARQRYQAATKVAQDYLTGLDIPDGLVTRMLSTNSRESSFLSEKEIKALRNRRFYEELYIAECGMSEAEEEEAAKAAMKGFKPKTTSEGVARRMEVSGKYIECSSGVLRKILEQGKAEYLRIHGGKKRD
jgi:hypothetical protein